MTEPNTVNAVTDEDANPEQHTGDRIPDHTESGDQPANGEDETSHA